MLSVRLKKFRTIRINNLWKRVMPLGRLRPKLGEIRLQRLMGDSYIGHHLHIYSSLVLQSDRDNNFNYFFHHCHHLLLN